MHHCGFQLYLKLHSALHILHRLENYELNTINPNMWGQIEMKHAVMLVLSSALDNCNQAAESNLGLGRTMRLNST